MPMDNPFLDVEQRMLGDIYTSSEVMDNLEVLCDDFGARWGGTEEERKAAEFMRDRLHGYGLAGCRLEPFDYVGWVRGKASLRVVRPVEREIPCISLPMSPPAHLEAGLAYVGVG